MNPVGKVIVAALLLSGSVGMVDAQETKSAATQRAVRLSDRPLVDTNGVPRRFVSDILARGPVLLSFTFTGCTAFCPAADVVMDDVAERLKGRNPGGVRLITLTLDPLTDTPEQLRRERAASLHPDRTFLTGQPDDVWAILDGLGVEAGTRQDHDLAFLLIGRGGAGIQTLSGFAGAEELAILAGDLR
ncbi:hypothetical protein C0214_27115 (plasmid) [Methylobacterium sp. DM1]|nr:hypothetical protein C0214_27115 [Methylobacterium sp. DM1]